MEYLVCKFKGENKYFITTRKSRETMLSVLQDLGQEIESIVLKSFQNYTLADIYKKEMESIDKDIDGLIR
jgi:formylmethanofuran dehydrogenase subunit A